MSIRLSIKHSFVKATLGINTFVAINIAAMQSTIAQHPTKAETPLDRIVQFATDELNKGVSEKSEGPYGINYIMEAYKFPTECTEDEIKKGRTIEEISWCSLFTAEMVRRALGRHPWEGIKEAKTKRK